MPYRRSITPAPNVDERFRHSARSRWAILLTATLIATAVAMDGSIASASHGPSFEQDHRLTSLTLETGTDTFAPQNQFGGAFTSLALSQINGGIDSSIADGSLSWLFRMEGLDDLTGTNSAAFDVGIVSASPVLPEDNPATYDGTSDLDWWYDPDPAEVDEAGTPLTTLPAVFADGTFDAGPGSVVLSNVVGPSSFSVANARLRATVGASTAPTESTNGFPPGHLPAENIPEGLTSFATMNGGRLAGDISAGSLAATPIPTSLTGSGIGSCSQTYDATHTFLELMLSGCTVIGIPVVAPTQPDRDLSPGGGTYTFTTDGNRHVSGCLRNAVPATLPECYAGAAYSAYFLFTTNRVILRHPCAPGSYSADGSSPCTLADAGYFAAGYGNAAQTACPAGTTSSAGATECFPITTTTVHCTKDPVPIGVATTCTATVVNQAAGPVPTGEVAWTAPAGSGTFSPTLCTLAGAGPDGACSVSFTPASGSSGQKQLGATYAGDAEHAGSTDQLSLQVAKRATSTSVRCKPKTVVHGKATVCRATVTDVSPGITSLPKGKVRWTARKRFGRFKTTTCRLVTRNGVRTCKVTFRTSRRIRGRVTVNGTYLGDPNHRTSSRRFRFRVT